MFKIIIMKTDRVNILCKYPLQLTICTKSIELYEVYSREKTNYFLLSSVV